MTNARVLLMIAAFIAVTFGSFVWYVASWQGNTPAEETRP